MVYSSIKIENGKLISVEGDRDLTEKELLLVRGINQLLQPFASKVKNIQGEIIVSLDRNGIISVDFDETVEPDHRKQVLQILNRQA